MALAGCGGSFGAGQSGQAVVEGTVTAGPTCPVQRADSPCPDKIVVGAQVEARRGGDAVAAAHTDSTGRYVLELSPGTYLIVATNAGGYRSTASREVSVTTGQRLTVDLVVDTGIR